MATGGLTVDSRLIHRSVLSGREPSDEGVIASFSHTDSSHRDGWKLPALLLSFVMLSLSFACSSIEGLHLCLRSVSRNKPMARESQFEWNRFRRGFRRNPSLTLAG